MLNKEAFEAEWKLPVELELFNSVTQKREKHTITIDGGENDERDQYIVKLAIRDMLKRLEDSKRGLYKSNKDVYWAASGDIEKELEELSVKHQVLCNKTAFVCVKESIDPTSLGKPVESYIIPTLKP